MTSMPWSELIKDAEAGGVGEPVPEGPYRVEITKAEAKNASTGKQMIVVTMKILEGPYAGRPLWNNFVITNDNPNALAWFFKHMAALGFNKDFFALNPSLETLATQMVGRRAMVQAGVRNWNNEVRNEIKSFSADTNAPTAAQVIQPAAQVATSADGGNAVATPAPQGPAPTAPF